MILCSCNVISDREVHAALATGGRASVGGVFRSLGCEAKCGRCVRSIAAAIDGGSGGSDSCADGDGCESCHGDELVAA